MRQNRPNHTLPKRQFSRPHQNTRYTRRQTRNKLNLQNQTGQLETLQASLPPNRPTAGTTLLQKRRKNGRIPIPTSKTPIQHTERHQGANNAGRNDLWNMQGRLSTAKHSHMRRRRILPTSTLSRFLSVDHETPDSRC